MELLSLTQFAQVLNMPTPASRKCVAQHVENAVNAPEAEVKVSMTSAASDLKQDFPISFDGSWDQRGHTAVYGYGSVISIICGKVCNNAMLHPIGMLPVQK